MTRGPADGTEAAQATAAQLCNPSAADEFGAEAMAKACRSRVEVESARTDYSELYVEPSGNRTIVTAIVPQRARRHDGTWGPIDTTLQQVGDQLAPIATAANVRFSTGGAGPFATLNREGHSLTLSWPAPLPKPTVSGNTATYADVLPDVDLVVRATDTGFSHLLVVKTARAAANPTVRRATYHIGGDATLTSTAEGGVIAEAGGVRIASADRPVMWETVKRQGASALDQPDGENEPVKTARVGAAISAGHLVLTPDPAMLADPGARFPLVIDPLFITGENQWAYATSDDQSNPTTDTTIASGDPSPAAATLNAGLNPGTGARVRSFLRFPISTLAGKQILSAKITGKVDHTWKCTDNRSNYFYRTASISTTPRQSWPGPALQLLLGHDSVHANEASCSEQNMTFEVTSALSSDLQTFATAKAANYFVGISAGENTSGLNESTTDRWMRYFLADFKLNVTYNTRPNTPDTLTVDSKACATGANRPFIKTLTPTLRAHVTDPDHDHMNVSFTWAKWNGSSFVDAGSGTQSNVADTGTALFTVTSSVDGGIYNFRAVSNDSPSHSPSLSSAAAGTCEWQVDITPPAVPTVAADVYKEGPNASGSVGQTGRFTFSSSSDTKSFLWGWSDPPATPLAPSTLGGSVSIDWTPTSEGPRTLFVRAIDRAGNTSNKAYQFNVASPSTALARWPLDDSPGSTQLADATLHGNALTVSGGVLGASGRLVPGADGLPRSAIQFDGIDDVATTSGPVLADTSKSFSVAAWVKLADNTVSHRAVEQVDTTGGNSAFALEYDKATNAWKFTAPTADGSAFPGVTSIDPTDPTNPTNMSRLNTWTHLVGTYDSAAKALKLYVNGALKNTATGITTWDANGALRIGASWAGAISEVQVWNRVISATEVFGLSDPIQVGKVGEWHMEDIGFGPTFDASPVIHDLTLYNGASIPPSGAGHTGTGLLLDGVDDYAATDGQVLHTDQSFTVSVWVRPTTTAVYQAFVSQQSNGPEGGFTLYLGSENGGVWKFRMYASPTDTTNTTFAVASAVNATTAFHHLVGVFDAQNREMRLYVDGMPKATSPMNALWQPWDATGPLLIGRDQNGIFTSGDIDEVCVLQGAVTDPNITCNQ